MPKLEIEDYILTLKFKLQSCEDHLTPSLLWHRVTVDTTKELT